MSPRIFYFAPDRAAPSGGRKVIYQHVDILNRAGFDATALHTHPGFRYRWFDNETRVGNLREVRFRDGDHLVLPETAVPRDASRISIRRWPFTDPEGPGAHSLFRRLAWSSFDTRGIKKVIFNQGCYLSFAGCGFDAERPPTTYRDDDVRAVMVVSDDSRRYLEHICPTKPVFTVPVAVSSLTFPYSERKRNVVSYMPRRNFQDAEQVLNILQVRHALRGYAVQAIDGVGERDVRRILGESRFFLNFGTAEGFSLPAAEAMASGCVVIGYHGRGGREFFQPDFCLPIEPGDVLSFAKAVEAALRASETDPDKYATMGRQASRFIAENYNGPRQEAAVVAAWKSILQKS